MAALMLEDAEYKAIEHILSRLSQLSSSIQSFRMDILRSNPLPTPSSVQASTQIIQRNLQGVLDSLNDNAGLLNRMAVHPSPNFPGRTKEPVLGQLLRKKLEPDVEELVQKGREVGEAAMATPEGLEQMQEVWQEVRGWVQRRIAQYVSEEADDAYTKEERAMGIENVRTGLKRDLEEEDEEDEDEDEDGEERSRKQKQGAEEEGRKDQPPRGPEPETLLWFMTTGDFAVPPNVEYERKTNVYKGLQGVNIPPQDEAMADVNDTAPATDPNVDANATQP